MENNIAVLFDSWCGEAIAWGYYENGKPVIKTLLSRSDAKVKYGEITNEDFGPRGGWKSVTFGETKFISSYLRS